MSALTPELLAEMAWDHLEMAREDHSSSPSKKTYDELLACVEALASVLKQAPAQPSRKAAPETEGAPHDGDDLAINLAENEARIATATEAWAVVQTPEIDGEKFETLFFHPATKRWVWDKDPDYDLKECLLATVEAGEVALDYALGLNEETPRLMKVAIADGRISEIPEQSK